MPWNQMNKTSCKTKVHPETGCIWIFLNAHGRLTKLKNVTQLFIIVSYQIKLIEVKNRVTIISSYILKIDNKAKSC